MLYQLCNFRFQHTRLFINHDANRLHILINIVTKHANVFSTRLVCCSTSFTNKLCGLGCWGFLLCMWQSIFVSPEHELLNGPTAKTTFFFQVFEYYKTHKITSLNLGWWTGYRKTSTGTHTLHQTSITRRERIFSSLSESLLRKQQRLIPAVAY